MEQTQTTPQDTLQNNGFPSVPVKHGNPLFKILIGLVLLGIGVGLGWVLATNKDSISLSPKQTVSTYDDCIDAKGSTVQESYPATCVTRDGARFTQPLTDEEKQNLQPPDSTGKWKTYSGVGVSFRFPADWIEEPVQIFGSRSMVEFKYKNTPLFVLTLLGNYSQLSGKPYATLDEYIGPRIDKARSIEINDLPAKIITDPGDSGHVIPYEEVMFFNSDKSNIIALNYEDSYYDSPNKAPNTLDQILSTFKFVETSPTPVLKPTKTLKYFLPIGWKTIQDKSRLFEAGYDPSTMKWEEPVSQSITIKVRPDPLTGYASDFNVRLLSYSGGSRHQFIYTSVQITPTKQDYLPDYKEVEYLYDGRSCLFLEGIGVSQIPSTWGMCDAGDNQAFLITTWSSGQELEAILQTVRLIKQ